MSHNPGVAHTERDAGHSRTSSSPGRLPLAADLISQRLQNPAGPLIRRGSERLSRDFTVLGGSNSGPRWSKRQATTDSASLEEAGSKQKSDAAQEQGSTTIALVSTTSLGDFRRNPHTIYWPLHDRSDQQEQQEWQEPRCKVRPGQHPLNALELLKKHTNYMCPGRRGHISYGQFKREESRDEHIVVKITNCRPRKRREAMREFEQLRTIDHCHIIAALDIVEEKLGDDDLNLYLLLYPLALYDLHKRLNTISKHNEQRQRDPSKWHKHEDAAALLTYLRCLSQAVLYLHTLENRIKHRDIKPANILIDAYGGVFLADFDISRQYKEGQPSSTEGVTELTIDYAPGHVKDPKMHRDLEWDVIGLGFVFVEILTVALGESRLDLFRFLAYGNLDHPYEEGDLPDIDYAQALENGNIGRWLDRLHQTSAESPDRVPLQNVDTARLKAVISHVMHMMKSPPGSGINATKRLDDAYACFSELGEPCDYCGPTSGREKRCVLTESFRSNEYLAAPPTFTLPRPPSATTEENRISPVFEDIEEDQTSSIRDQQSSRAPIHSNEAEDSKHRKPVTGTSIRVGNTAEPVSRDTSSAPSPETPRQELLPEHPYVLIQPATIPVEPAIGAASGQGAPSSPRKTVTIREPELSAERESGARTNKKLTDSERRTSVTSRPSEQRPNGKSARSREVSLERGYFNVISTKDDYYDRMRFETFRALSGPRILEYTPSRVKPFYNLNKKRTEDFYDNGHDGVFYKFQKRKVGLVTHDGRILDLPKCLGFRHKLIQHFRPVKVLFYPCDEKATGLILQGLPRRQMS